MLAHLQPCSGEPRSPSDCFSLGFMMFSISGTTSIKQYSCCVHYGAFSQCMVPCNEGFTCSTWNRESDFRTTSIFAARASHRNMRGLRRANNRRRHQPPSMLRPVVLPVRWAFLHRVLLHFRHHRKLGHVQRHRRPPLRST